MKIFISVAFFLVVLVLPFNYSFVLSKENEIYIKCLSQRGHGDRYPTFSPNNTKILFQSEDKRGVSVYIMDKDGKDRKEIVHIKGKHLFHPAFSPDMSKVAFTSYDPQNKQNGDVYIRNLEIGKDILVTKGDNIFGAIPNFSPDGKKIALALWSNRKKEVESGSGLHPEINTMDLDTSEFIRLTNNSSEDWRPVFSPDSQKIVFISNRDGNFEIYIMDADGENQRRLTYNDADDWDPFFSPSGRHIVFSSKRGGNWDIYIMNTNGSNQTRLTNDIGDEWDPSFSPDDKSIIFAGERDKKRGIFIMGNPWFAKD